MHTCLHTCLYLYLSTYLYIYPYICIYIPSFCIHLHLYPDQRRLPEGEASVILVLQVFAPQAVENLLNGLALKGTGFRELGILPEQFCV